MGWGLRSNKPLKRKEKGCLGLSGKVSRIGAITINKSEDPMLSPLNGKRKIVH